MLYSVDRFEGDVAVLVDDAGNSRDILRGMLPDNVRTGDVLQELDGVFVWNRTATETRRARILQLQNALRRRFLQK